jgi:ribosomal-protein-alanine N-acetyltransferase
MESFDRFPVLEMQGLVLREITAEDVGWFYDHFNIREIVEATAFPGPKDLDTAMEQLEGFIFTPFVKKTGFRWGITEKGRSRLIGSCGFYNWMKGGSNSAEMGYDLNPAYWGRGIMREALETIVRFGFDRMGLNRIQATIPAHNNRSLTLIRRLGFVQEGVLRQWSFLVAGT